MGLFLDLPAGLARRRRGAVPGMASSVTFAVKGSEGALAKDPIFALPFPFFFWSSWYSLPEDSFFSDSSSSSSFSSVSFSSTSACLRLTDLWLGHVSCWKADARCFKYSQLRRLRAHCDRQTLCAGVHLSDMVAQVPRVVVYHFGIFSITVTTENLTSADVESAFGRPLVFVGLISARHVVDS